jgi:hypothetical protein
VQDKYTTTGDVSTDFVGTATAGLGLSYSHISSTHPLLSAAYVEYAPSGSYIKLRFKNLTTERQRDGAARARAKQGQFAPGEVPGMRLNEAGLSWHPGRPKRGRVASFSGSSQRRLRVLTNSLPDTLPLPLFITLTYPEAWPDRPTKWKRQLDLMLTKLSRFLGEPCIIWKLEPQERGAPHFHLAVYTKRFLRSKLLAAWWYAIVKSGDPRHKEAGTQVKRARTRRGSLSYIGKYIGKRVSPKLGWEAVGRYWGVRNRPKGMLKRVWVPQRTAYRIRRVLWRYRASHDRRYKRTPYRGDAQGTSGYLPGPLASRLVAYGLGEAVNKPGCGPP